MRIINSSYQILTDIDEDMLYLIEYAGRTCYKSKSNDIDTTKKFIASLIASGHESVLEHQSISVKVICDRAMSHQIVRHRLASYSQESQRYCNYSKDKFENEIKFVRPSFFSTKSVSTYIWLKAMEDAEDHYFNLIKEGYKPEEARTVLPNSTATEIVMTLNIRAWRHFFKERVINPHAQVDIRQLFSKVLNEFKSLVPVLFDDIIE